MSYPIVEVSVIVMENGRVLIGRPTDGKWETPTVPLKSLEAVKEAGGRAAFELAGITVEPQNVLFFGEELKPEDHKVFIYLFSKYLNGDLKPSGEWQEAEWVDVRELAKYQDEMSEATVDGFYKFSLVLRQSAERGGGTV
jgi:ADP-ribose pyrophosphatase YjhB (NUDIX family)